MRYFKYNLPRLNEAVKSLLQVVYLKTSDFRYISSLLLKKKTISISQKYHQKCFFLQNWRKYNFLQNYHQTFQNNSTAKIDVCILYRSNNPGHRILIFLNFFLRFQLSQQCVHWLVLCSTLLLLKRILERQKYFETTNKRNQETFPQKNYLEVQVFLVYIQMLLASN